MKEQNVIEAALVERDGLEGELSGLQRLAGEIETQLAKLEVEASLADAAMVAEIGRLRVVAGLLPRRLAHREEALALADRNLQSACESFVSSELGPKCRDLAKRARTKMGIALKAHFSAPSQLEAAVERSTLVLEAENIGSEVKVEANPSDGLVAYAHRLLGALRKAEALEARLQ